ncbi:MarR family winged helix-turn-helix transcriptional regulator [Marinobacterium stanieri]|uniref:MarR family winged helix-turn-helix transcriptional regulator n=1 Tax=Marinobacterium stanieri TaxID=49186 RepID=UPI0002558877|nr:MarR family transcriptional regulator [Marinobacterium stanieri]
MTDPVDNAHYWRDIVVCLRQIMRATDLHSKQVKKTCGLTLPQVMLLRSIADQGDVSVRKLALDISLSQATVTSILDRLEERGLVERVRSLSDRRIVNARLTAPGLSMLEGAPELLGETFMQRFQALPETERVKLVQSLQQLTALMDQE